MKVAVWTGVLVAAVVAVFVFTAIGASVLLDARDLTHAFGWWSLLALAWPVGLGVYSWRAR